MLPEKMWHRVGSVIRPTDVQGWEGLKQDRHAAAACAPHWLENEPGPEISEEQERAYHSLRFRRDSPGTTGYTRRARGGL